MLLPTTPDPPCRYFYFGSATSELITADLAERSPFSGHSLLLPGLTLDRFVNVCIALNAWTTYPVLVVVLQVRRAAGRATTIPWLRDVMRHWPHP